MAFFIYLFVFLLAVTLSVTPTKNLQYRRDIIP